jgi:ribosome-binding factor A
MKHRLLRVNELLKRELSEIVQREFTFDGMLVTVNGVDVTPDLRQGHVFLSVIGPENRQQEVLEFFNKKRGILQRKVGKRVVLKFMPHLHFKLDDSIARGVRVMSIMDELAPMDSDEDEVIKEGEDERKDDE